MNPNQTHDDPFADLNPLNSQIPAFAIPPTDNGNFRVETVTSSSEVSPIDQSESINWNQQMNQFDTNNRYDWTRHTGQTRDGSSNVRNNFNNTSNYSTRNNTLLPSLLSVATSTAAE